MYRDVSAHGSGCVSPTALSELLATALFLIWKTAALVACFNTCCIWHLTPRQYDNQKPCCRPPLQEPLWLYHALATYDGPLTYQGTWRATALHVARHHGAGGPAAPPGSGPPPPVPGFDSLFLYKRWCRNHMQLVRKLCWTCTSDPLRRLQCALHALLHPVLSAVFSLFCFFSRA